MRRCRQLTAPFHVQGRTACPTPIGSVALQNTGGSAMNVSVGGGAPWLDLSGAMAMVPAGGSAPLSFQSNCSHYIVGTQSATLSIQASDSASGASAGQASVSISLTVQWRPTGRAAARCVAGVSWRAR